MVLALICHIHLCVRWCVILPNCLTWGVRVEDGFLMYCLVLLTFWLLTWQ